jgi:hypothetical protein
MISYADSDRVYDYAIEKDVLKLANKAKKDPKQTSLLIGEAKFFGEKHRPKRWKP